MSSIDFASKQMTGEGFYNVSPEEVQEKKSSVTLIDVRRPDEFHGVLGHIAGAKFVTLETDLRNVLPTMDKDATYVFICKSGGRSGSATAFAQSLGFKTVYNMEGGMMRWNQLGLPVNK